MQNKNLVFNFFIVIVFFIVFFFFIGKADNDNERIIKYVKIAGKSIKVEVAMTQTERERGLSGREWLNDDEGMLFVFERSGQYPFWMKDMNFPIDIIWISEDMKVVYIKKDARPELYPETYGFGVFDGNAKYVLEVVAGFSEKNNLKKGDVMFLYDN